MVTNFISYYCINFITSIMSKYAVQQKLIASHDIHVAAETLLQLKMSGSSFENTTICNKIYPTIHHDTDFLSTVSLQSIVGTRHCAWTKLFSRVKFELRLMRDIIVNMFSYENNDDNYPNIDETFQQMKDLYSDGYHVIDMATMTVIHELRSFMLQYFHSGVFTQDGHDAQDVKSFSNVLISLNKYEIYVWKQQKQIHCNSSPEHEIEILITFIQNYKAEINTLVPELQASIIDIIDNNIMCIEETGLLAKHALSHITEHLQNAGIVTK